MLSTELRNNCQNCEFLRIDNFCLVRGKYILTKNIHKDRDCPQFSCKNFEREISPTHRNGKKDIHQFKAVLIEINNSSQLEL